MVDTNDIYHAIGCRNVAEFSALHPYPGRAEILARKPGAVTIGARLERDRRAARLRDRRRRGGNRGPELSYFFAGGRAGARAGAVGGGSIALSGRRFQTWSCPNSAMPRKPRTV